MENTSRRGKNRTGSTDEGRRYESRFGSQGSVDQTDRLVKQGTKENGTALHPQSFDPGSQGDMICVCFGSGYPGYRKDGKPQKSVE